MTGGAGFVGAHICRALLQVGADVAVLDDLSTGSGETLAGLGITPCVASVLDATAVARAVRGADAVVHLAALSSVPGSLTEPIRTNAVNVTGTLILLEACREAGVRHVVFASSSSVYGAQQVTPTHELLVPRPVSPYAVSKLAAESYALAYQATMGLPVLALRLFNVYGPGQRSTGPYSPVVPAFIDAALMGAAIPIHGDGRQTRVFVNVGSVASAVTTAVLEGIHHPGPVNLTSGTATSINELVEHIEQLVDRPLTRHWLPERPGDIRHSCGEGTVLAGLMPHWRPVPLREGLASTVDWASGRAREQVAG